MDVNIIRGGVVNRVIWLGYKNFGNDATFYCVDKDKPNVLVDKIG